MRQFILAITVLILTLPICVSAQDRTPKEALEGLRDFGVIVKYANADGLPEVMRPTVLQMLQDKARDTLRLAEIPLVQSIDEAEMAGRPCLVFTVTLNKHTDTAPAIVVEARLNERVRLWRDPAKEMELATWVAHGIGAAKVTEKTLFDVFEHQVNGFIKAYREVNPNPTQTETSASDSRAQVKDNSNSLQGLKGVSLYVSCGPSLPIDSHLEALSKTLQSEAEKKLVEAGIPVLKYVNQTEPAGDPLLYLYLKLMKRKSSDPPIGIQSNFWQRVQPVRNPKKTTYAVTWESYSSDGGPITDDAVLRVMNAQLDEFIKKYKEANPKLSATAK